MTPGIQELMREVERVRDGFRRAVLAGDRGGGRGAVRGRGDAGRPAGGHRRRGPRGGAQPRRAGRRAPACGPGVRPALAHGRPVPGGRRGAGRPSSTTASCRGCCPASPRPGGGRRCWRSRWRRSGRGGCWRCGRCGTTRRCSPGSACPRTRCTRRRCRCPGARDHAAGGERPCERTVGIVGGACDDAGREGSAGVASAAGPGAGRRAAGRPGHAGGLRRLPRVALRAGQRGHGAVRAVRRGGARDALADPRQPGGAGAHPARGAAGRLAAGHPRHAAVGEHRGRDGRDVRARLRRQLRRGGRPAARRAGRRGAAALHPAVLPAVRPGVAGLAAGRGDAGRAAARRGRAGAVAGSDAGALHREAGQGRRRARRLPDGARGRLDGPGRGRGTGSPPCCRTRPRPPTRCGRRGRRRWSGPRRRGVATGR